MENNRLIMEALSLGLNRGDVSLEPPTRPRLAIRTIKPGQRHDLLERSHIPKAFGLWAHESAQLYKKNLLQAGNSRISYSEYAVFLPDEDETGEEDFMTSIMADGQSALDMFHGAMEKGIGLDEKGKLVELPATLPKLKSRTRLITAKSQRPKPLGAVISEGLEQTSPISSSMHQASSVDQNHRLELTPKDYDYLELHPWTLSSLHRYTHECAIWDTGYNNLYIILGFSAQTSAPYDFLSMRYNILTRTTNALIRESSSPRWNDSLDLNEYEELLDTCKDHLSHPLTLPVVLLQVQFSRAEEVGSFIELQLQQLELSVVEMTDLPKSDGQRPVPGAAKDSNIVTDSSTKLEQTLHHSESPQAIQLMTRAHEVLNSAIKLLDTLRWIERATKLVVSTGDELNTTLKAKRKEKGDVSDRASLSVLDSMPSGPPGRNMQPDWGNAAAELGSHWHAIRQYLECQWRVCTALETDQRLAELRCRAQIDIIYSAMAHKDNEFNRRMVTLSEKSAFTGSQVNPQASSAKQADRESSSQGRQAATRIRRRQNRQRRVSVSAYGRSRSLIRNQSATSYTRGRSSGKGSYEESQKE